MNTKILSFLLVICSTFLFDYSYAGYYRRSLKSDVFEPLRPKEPPKRISAECGSVITEAYGRLEKTYTRGEVEDGSKCIWTLRAPANHVVNVIIYGFDFENMTSQPPAHLDDSGSRITLNDYKRPNGKELEGLTVNDYQQFHGRAFYISTSTERELVVEIVYHDNTFYAIQKIYVEYEFLNVDDANRLLRQYKLPTI